MELKNLNKKAKKVWLLRYLASYLFLLIFFIPIIAGVATGGDITVAAIILSLIFIIYVSLTIIVMHFQYKNYKYGYDDTRIVIQKGVIFKSNAVIPIRQIQDLHLYEGPAMQIFKLSGVVLSTAGSNFTISCIAQDDAKKMIADLETSLNKLLEEGNTDDKIL